MSYRDQMPKDLKPVSRSRAPQLVVMPEALAASIEQAITDLACKTTDQHRLYANGVLLSLRSNDGIESYALVVPLDASARTIKSSILKAIPGIVTIKRIDPADKVDPAKLEKILKT